MELLKRLFKRKHKCKHTLAIASKYLSFSIRDIIYQCKCGKRELKRESFFFDQPFPIETLYGYYNTEEFNKLLTENNRVDE
jgi:hypothetical protein